MDPWTPRLKRLIASPRARVSIGLAVTGVGTLLAVASARLPFLVISSSRQSIALAGGAVTDNLHLGLIATGALTALAGLLHALGRPALRTALLVPGPISGLFCLLSWLSMSPRLAYHSVTDRTLWATLGTTPFDVQLGAGFTLSVLASALLVVLGVIALLGRTTASPSPPSTARPREVSSPLGGHGLTHK